MVLHTEKICIASQYEIFVITADVYMWVAGSLPLSPHVFQVLNTMLWQEYVSYLRLQS